MWNVSWGTDEKSSYLLTHVSNISPPIDSYTISHPFWNTIIIQGSMRDRERETNQWHFMFGTIKEKMAVVINTFWNSADNKYLLADWKSIKQS